jgi:pimeloyl-ACP methyl ester carboxylesterase
MEWEGFVDDVLAVVDAWDCGPLAGVGHSKGGAALLLAEQRRPGTFTSLYCYEPVVFPPEARLALGGSNPLAEAARKRRPTFDSLEDAYDNFASKPPLSQLAPDALHAYVDHGFARQPDGSVRLKCRPEIEAETYEMASRHEAFAHLGEISCPVTIARGVGDDGPGGFADVVAGELRHGRLLAFDDLGHFGPLQDPPRIAASIIASL